MYGSTGLTRWLSGKNLPANARDAGSIPGSGRSPGEENGNPLQYSCLGNFMDRGAWHVIVHGVTNEFDMTEHACNECKNFFCFIEHMNVL